MIGDVLVTIHVVTAFKNFENKRRQPLVMLSEGSSSSIVHNSPLQSKLVRHSIVHRNPERYSGRTHPMTSNHDVRLAHPHPSTLEQVRDGIIERRRGTCRRDLCTIIERTCPHEVFARELCCDERAVRGYPF